VERVSAWCQTGAIDVHRRQTDGARVLQTVVVERQLGQCDDSAGGTVVLLYGVNDASERLSDQQPGLQVGLDEHTRPSTDELRSDNQARL